MKDVTQLLFETNAFRICEENKPFWYTSGKIGPYFINTHFLYGSESEANELLDFINKELEEDSKENIPQKLFEKVLNQYNNNGIYKTVIDSFISFLTDRMDINNIDYISGGERRDWYFSNICAHLLNKPHLTIYKDLTVVESNSNFTENKLITSLKDKKVLHIADLLNQSSSYTRSWIPAIKNLGSEITNSGVIVDRMQGGAEVLDENNIRNLSLIQVNERLFNIALDLNIINESQLEMLKRFAEEPDSSMKYFLKEHPDFLEESLNSQDEKTAKRAKMCVEQNIYGLN